MLINQDYKEDQRQPEEREDHSSITLGTALDLIDDGCNGVTIGITTDWADFDFIKTTGAAVQHMSLDTRVTAIGIEQDFICLMLEE